jgi:hypothetical protein
LIKNEAAAFVACAFDIVTTIFANLLVALADEAATGPSVAFAASAAQLGAAASHAPATTKTTTRRSNPSMSQPSSNPSPRESGKNTPRDRGNPPNRLTLIPRCPFFDSLLKHGFLLSASYVPLVRPRLHHPSSLLHSFTILTLSLPAAETVPTGPAPELFQKAQNSRWHSNAAKLKFELLATSDSRSFLVLWKPVKEPKHWIVTLHGTHGFATDDLAIWHPQLKDREAALLCVQWWLGVADGPEAYYTPVQIYREIDAALQKLGAQPGSAMLHGFSRGSANSYAVAALDAGRGQRYFSLAVASSGGVGLDYPPTRAILDGTYGEQPPRGTRWVTAAGARDPHSDRDGIPGMKRAAAWLKEQGATVLETIEDPDYGHGALQTNPKNVQRVLDLFLSQPRKPQLENQNAKNKYLITRIKR